MPDSLHGWKQRDLKPALWFSLRKTFGLDFLSVRVSPW